MKILLSVSLVSSVLWTVLTFESANCDPWETAINTSCGTSYCASITEPSGLVRPLTGIETLIVFGAYEQEDCGSNLPSTTLQP